MGAVSTVVSFQVNTSRAINEVGEGKYNDMTAAAWGHWSDNLGTAVSIVGLAGAVAGSAPVTIIASIAGLGLYAYSKCTETPYDDLDQTEMNYRAYFKSNISPREFVYDNSDDVYAKLHMNGGNIRRLTCLDDEQNNIFKKYLFYSGSRGLISGEDTRAKGSKPSSDWLDVLKGLHKATKDKPELLNKAVLEFYKNYTEACALYLTDKKGRNIKTISDKSLF